jgi:hypothetical protein
MNDIQLLSQIGEELYGPQWQSKLSQQIVVSDRSVRRWANGTDKIPWGVWHDLHRLVQSRAAALGYWSDVLYERVFISTCDPTASVEYNAETDWYAEVHDPDSGRRSMVHYEVLGSLSAVLAMIKRHPGMIFSVRVPQVTSAAEWDEFREMNPQKL